MADNSASLPAAATASGAHSMVLARFAQLPVGGTLEWDQTDDPLSLHQALMSMWPGQFAWTRQERIDQLWHLGLVRRLAGKTCCGSCGG